jgi:pimeloyl-ACP methyl ester carboxylesterase
VKSGALGKATPSFGIPGSWVVQIRDAGHGLMYQYPSEFNRALITFLEDNHEHNSLR